jgi:hypothetical protein
MPKLRSVGTPAFGVETKPRRYASGEVRIDFEIRALSKASAIVFGVSGEDMCIIRELTPKAAPRAQENLRALLDPAVAAERLGAGWVVDAATLRTTTSQSYELAVGSLHVVDGVASYAYPTVNPKTGRATVVHGSQSGADAEALLRGDISRLTWVTPQFAAALKELAPPTTSRNVSAIAENTNPNSPAQGMRVEIGFVWTDRPDGVTPLPIMRCYPHAAVEHSAFETVTRLLLAVDNYF